MSMPRISDARASASSGPSATLMPPALPRPPTCTCALTTTRPPSSAAAARASAGVRATRPSGTGTPTRANNDLPWNSKRSIRWARFARRQFAIRNSQLAGTRDDAPNNRERRTKNKEQEASSLGDVLVDPVDHGGERGTGREDLGEALLLQGDDVG